MSESGIFAYSNYKEIMKMRLRAPNGRGALSRAAEALNCQRSFLSRIMNSKMQITPDLAFKLARHWKLSREEREYFQALVDLERAVDPEYVDHLRERVKILREAHESLANRAKRPTPTNTHDTLYFSSWQWTAIHFLTSIKEFQSVKAISERLNLSSKLVTDCLEQLRNWGFIQRVGARWEYAGGEYHLPKDSPLVILHHQNWRQKAVMSAQSLRSDAVHFTNVHTISRKDFPHLKELLLRFISESNELLKSSDEEDCVALLCDLFTVE